jgi:tRNA 2-thiocytidine biosynthesis protein TtcA
MDILTAALAKPVPGWLRRFVKQVGGAVARHGMLEDGDAVVLAVSGGKDSLGMALALALRTRWTLDRYRMTAVHVSYPPYPLSADAAGRLQTYFADLEIPLVFRTADLDEAQNPGSPSCYECARARRRVLFEEARRRDAPAVAFGHHRDDVVLTGLMNLVHHGRFASMEPVQSFFKGSHRAIRPLCDVPEATLRRVAAELPVPVASVSCPRRGTSERDRAGQVLRALTAVDRRARENVYRALATTWEADAGSPAGDDPDAQSQPGPAAP